MIASDNAGEAAEASDDGSKDQETPEASDEGDKDQDTPVSDETEKLEDLAYPETVDRVKDDPIVDSDVKDGNSGEELAGGTKTEAVKVETTDSSVALSEVPMVEKEASSVEESKGSEGGKSDESESGKEMTKKLSAAAPPFNPSTVPLFGSVPIPVPVPVPGFKDHGGILPSPVNIAPMIVVNPVRRSSHQSATARVPYGPRLSGGFNRNGSRVPRNKPGFHAASKDHTVIIDGSHFGPTMIMNPHAAEFVPGQTWLPNGYPVSPTGYLSSPNSIPNGYGVPVVNGFTVSPVDSPTLGAVESGDGSSTEIVVDKHLIEEEKPIDGPKDKTDNDEKPNDKDTIETSDGKETVGEDQENPEKCWGDYSDAETEIVEVTSETKS